MFTRAEYWLGLVLMLALGRILPARRQPLAVALGGMALITWLSPISGLAALAIGAWVSLVLRHGGRRQRWAALAGIAAVLLGAKIAAHFDVQATAQAPSLWLPLGFSYLIFRMLHVLAEADRGAPACGPAAFWAYVFFPPFFTAGPIERIDQFRDAWPTRADAADFARGGTRIVIGFIKKFILCDLLAAHLQTGLKLDPGVLSQSARLGGGTCWAVVALSYLRIYLDLSAYADIAVGAGRLFGFQLMENFRSPLLSTSPQDFWRRWHISLTQWCASYVYMPLVGACRSPYLPLFTSFLVMGMWHSLGWNRVGWAAWQAGGILTHVFWKRTLDRRGFAAWRRSPLWKIAAWLLTQSFVVAGYAFLANGEQQFLGDSLRILGRMLLWVH